MFSAKSVPTNASLRVCSTPTRCATLHPASSSAWTAPSRYVLSSPKFVLPYGLTTTSDNCRRGIATRSRCTLANTTIAERRGQDCCLNCCSEGMVDVGSKAADDVHGPPKLVVSAVNFMSRKKYFQRQPIVHPGCPINLLFVLDISVFLLLRFLSSSQRQCQWHCTVHTTQGSIS